MASNINPLNINGSYPIAGQDNDSQGFRDNFTNIKTNLTYAKSELEDLQSKAVLLSSLTNGNPVVNDFNGAQLINAKTKGFTETVYVHSSQTGSIIIDYTAGAFQTISATGAVTLTFATTWPDNYRYAKVRLLITADANVPISLPPSVSIGPGAALGTPIVLTSTTAKTYMMEFSSYNGIDVIYLPLFTV